MRTKTDFNAWFENVLRINEPHLPMHVPHVGRALARLVVFSLCIGLLLPTHARAATFPVIGEVAWAGSSLSTSDEWVELWNPSDTFLSLDGYRLVGVGGEDLGIVFGPNDQIAPRGTFIIANFHSTDTRSNLAVTAHVVTSTLSLSNETLSLSLVDASGTVIDRAGSGSSPFAGTSTQAGKASMIRVSPLLPGHEAASWMSALSATNLKPGTSDLGTPGVCDQCSFVQAAIVVPEDIPSTESATSSEAIIPPVTETAEPTPDVLPTSTEVIVVDPDTASSSSTSSTPSATEQAVSEPAPVVSSTVVPEDSTIVAEEVTTVSSPATTTSAQETTTVDTTSTPPASSTETVPVVTNTVPEPSQTNTVVAPVTTIDISPTNVVPTTSSTSNLNSNSSTSVIDLNVTQTTSSPSNNAFHVELALTLNNSVTVSPPTQNHDGENLKELIQLLKTLIKHGTFQMAAALSESQTTDVASPEAKTVETVKAATTKAAVKAATTTAKPKTTTTAAKKTTTASKPAPMPTTILDAPSIAQDAPRVALTGTVASPPQLLAKNQFVIQTPDGRGLLVLGNGKQPSPAIDQTIRVEGTLVMNDDGLILRMYTADRWSSAPTEVVREPRLVNLLSPSMEDEWSLIEVTGTVQTIAKQSVLLDLEDSQIRLKISPILDYRTERLKKGDVIRVRGLLGISKDEVTIHPRSESEITILSHASSTVAQASTASHNFPSWMPIGAAGITIAATHGVKRLQKYREQQRLNTMLTQAQDQLISHVDLPSSHLV